MKTISHHVDRKGITLSRDTIILVALGVIVLAILVGISGILPNTGDYISQSIAGAFGSIDGIIPGGG